MIDKQGRKLVEGVSKIECSDKADSNIRQCKVVSENNLPTRYKDIEEVNTDSVNSDNQEQSSDKYTFKEPVCCKIVFGSELNMIECRD